jgi:hypothetical protein
MKAAVLHALSNYLIYLADIIQSIGLIISSVVIFFKGSPVIGQKVT